MATKIRIIISVVLVGVYAVFGAIWQRMLPQLQGISAARVLNDDSVIGNALSQWFRSGDIVGWVVTLLFVVLFVIIWWPLIKKMLIGGSSLALIVVMALVVVSGTACSSERATTQSEKYGSQDVIAVQPNQTAFVIPATGGSFSDQAKFDSVDYLESRKVASKRVTIDKENVGQKYVPKVFVILVDRTPVARQWTAEAGTGTNSSNESLCAESNESIQVCFQISMAAAVREEEASTYLYNFPTTRLQDQQVSGVYLATALDTVVDNQVRQYLQKIIGNETASRNLRQIIADKAQIIASGERQAIDYFRRQGITIAYVGLGGQLGLDPAVQKVINELFVAQQRQQIAQVNATTTAIDAAAQKNALILKGEGDAQALAVLYKALGSDAANLGSVLESYRWDGSRLTVTLAPNTVPAIEVPQATPAPTAAPPTPAATATPKK
ncbi:MAG: hypothetical protein UX31_C0009G0008 [Candidatus Nomurabacteria bacterium GW2011_GWA1_46_11]|uniref:Band 7 domain-containing protein n=1 Tax=Candidatus Nomurabacteria bacterium GW2011_GWA1_46_11 TaxID=1618732 RepID=A0A0G1RLW9_9BACT|nr:MAG: hypothetical protein UW69_C0004G0007 [Microgenomates group bacterium GW2011_GWA2_44_7]KKT77685.1 MAG: hypothetical protein UW73_C0014G0008 [Microgenomates group bacterium GW2011_GWB1_44_8]KKU21930.1 MAG: hypothetical protein UX31_C0009G0008 [Candidatus Nomurabacteria bacterium GW2011_GWA1_46_11]